MLVLSQVVPSNPLLFSPEMMLWANEESLPLESSFCVFHGKHVNGLGNARWEMIYDAFVSKRRIFHGTIERSFQGFDESLPIGTHGGSSFIARKP